MKPLNSGNAVETLTPAGWWEMLFNYIQKKTSFFSPSFHLSSLVSQQILLLPFGCFMSVINFLCKMQKRGTNQHVVQVKGEVLRPFELPEPKLYMPIHTVLFYCDIQFLCCRCVCITCEVDMRDVSWRPVRSEEEMLTGAPR